MRRIIVAFWLVFVLSTPGLGAHIELPASGGTASGIGLVSGWKCEAGTLTVRFNGGNPLEMPYGSPRGGDTLDVCGDADNGYALLMNWNLLAPGQHTAVVYDDGIEFSRVNFTVVTPGVEFLRGVSGRGTVILSNGQEVRVEWAEGVQGFVATEFSAPPSSVGLCSTKTADIAITPLTSDGFFACSPRLAFVQGGLQFDSSDYDWFDKNARDRVCGEVLSGLTKQTTVDLRFGSSLNFSQPFRMYYDRQLIFEFR